MSNEQFGIPLGEAENIAIRMVQAARHSVLLSANVATAFAVTLAPFIREGVRDPASSRRVMRAALGIKGIHHTILEALFSAHSIKQDRRAWEIRTVPFSDRGDVRLIIDNIAALTSVGGNRFVLTEEPHDINVFSKQFDALWNMGADIYLVYAEGPLSAEANRVLVFSQDQMDRLIREIRATPKVLFSIGSERFEHLVCELLARDGLEVHLTPPSKDGGKDIFAWLDTPVGKHLYYIECKRYSPDKPVGVSLVRQLYGVVESESATAGMLVTTSRFTRGAVKFRDSVRNRLDLRDYDALLTWITKNAQRGRGSRVVGQEPRGTR